MSPAALFVTMGDAGVGTNPQNLDSMNGKVLRVQTDGTGYPGNPFSGSAARMRVFTYGHRNPQGIAFRPGSNAPYSVEHGPDRNDVFNPDAGQEPNGAIHSGFARPAEQDDSAALG